MGRSAVELPSWDILLLQCNDNLGLQPVIHLEMGFAVGLLALWFLRTCSASCYSLSSYLYPPSLHSHLNQKSPLYTDKPGMPVLRAGGSEVTYP